MAKRLKVAALLIAVAGLLPIACLLAANVETPCERHQLAVSTSLWAHAWATESVLMVAHHPSAFMMRYAFYWEAYQRDGDTWHYMRKLFNSPFPYTHKNILPRYLTRNIPAFKSDAEWPGWASCPAS